MSGRSSTQPKKRKRASDNSSKGEPAAKKVKRNKSKLENDLIDTSSNKRRLNKSAGKKNLPVGENQLKKNQSFFKTDSKINDDIPSRRIKLRDVKVVLDRTVVENYLKNKSMSKKTNSQNRSKRKIKRSKKVKNLENDGQKTLFHFFNCNTLSSQNPTINSKVLLPLIPIKQENNTFEKLIYVNAVKIERVSVSINDLVTMCDVKVNLEKIHPTFGLKVENEIISSGSNNLFSNDTINKINQYQADNWIMTEIPKEVSLDESLARIKIEDASPNSVMTNDENSMKMEISEESINSNEMNYSRDEKCQPSFSALEIERMSGMKMTDAISALSDDRLLSFYDEYPDVPMEEITENEIIKRVPDASSMNSSRHSWPVSDESGIFMSDESANFNELSGKFTVNNSFIGLALGNEETSIK